jgi:hypothetical protein
MPRRGPGGRSYALRRAGAGASTLVIALGVGASPVLAGTSTSSASPSLRAQARELYAPVSTYEHPTTPAERARSRPAATRVGKVINACQAPYLKRLQNSRRAKLDMLWDHATLLQTYQADIKPVSTQLTMLTASWASLSLRNRAMNEFVHAVAAEFKVTLDAAPFNSCAFVRGIAAHHFSYAWAKQSADGVQAAQWWKQISQAGNRTGLFWSLVGASEPPGRSSPGAKLFTTHQLIVLANLPGEIG